MNYLQLKSDMKFAPEEALLADYFGEGNYVPFHAKQVQQRKLPLIRGISSQVVYRLLSPP